MHSQLDDDVNLKYLRGEGTDLEVFIYLCVLSSSPFPWSCIYLIIGCVYFLWLQFLKDKKLKGQLGVNEGLFKRSAKVAEKADEVTFHILKLTFYLMMLFFFYTSSTLLLSV